jgi:hypothetical protein
MSKFLPEDVIPQGIPSVCVASFIGLHLRVTLHSRAVRFDQSVRLLDAVSEPFLPPGRIRLKQEGDSMMSIQIE